MLNIRAVHDSCGLAVSSDVTVPSTSLLLAMVICRSANSSWQVSLLIQLEHQVTVVT